MTCPVTTFRHTAGGDGHRRHVNGSRVAPAPERGAKPPIETHAGRTPRALVRSSVAMPPVEERNDRERLKAIEMAVGQIEKQFGKGSIMRLGQKDAVTADSRRSPPGSVSLDFALGIGGVPRGRVVEIFGPESSGKTTLDAADHRRGAEARRHGGIRRRRTRARCAVCQEARRRSRQSARVAARQRRTGARDRRGARPLRRRRRRRRRLGGGARAARRNRR